MTMPRQFCFITMVWGLLLCCHASAQTTDTATVMVKDSAVASDTTPAPPKPAVLRELPDTFVSRLKNEQAFAYANDPAYWQRPKQQQEPENEGWFSRLLGSKAFEYFLLVLFGGVLIYAIVRIVTDNNLAVFYRSAKRKAGGSIKQEGASEEEDLDERLRQLILAGSYQQAVRYMYLKSLRLLNDRQLIRYHPDATNYEYLRQLGSTPQGAPFKDLTSIYERVVYGEFPVGDQLFQRLHQYFEDFYKTVAA